VVQVERSARPGTRRVVKETGPTSLAGPPATEGSRTPRRAERLLSGAERLVGNPAFCYSAIAALQLRVIWNIWRYADLTNGDTSYYFTGAASWAHGLQENIVYYPLYDALWGTILAVVHNVYAATIIQRVVIVFAVALLVLALGRALLGPAVGFVLAAWWVVVPANYDPLYEVHLLGAAPILVTLLVVARMPRRQGLGIAVAILLASAVLVRNELLLVAALLAGALVVYELRVRRTNRLTRSVCLRAYVAPLAVALLVIAGAYARSYVQGNTAWGELVAKEELNFCQDYAASFQEHHPSEFVGNPFTSCTPLMVTTFGRSNPTLLEALAANPGAVAGFAAENTRLLPGGLQVSMFGATSFTQAPGFGPPVTEGSIYALVLAVLVIAGVVAAVIVAARGGALSLRRAPPELRWIWVAVASIAVATYVVVLTTRPWAEYMYGLTICAFLVVGWALLTLVRRVGAASLLAAFALVLAVTLAVVIPSAYPPAIRPIYDTVQRLQIVKQTLERPGSVLVTADNYNEACNYLASSAEDECTGIDWFTLSAAVSAKTPLAQVLDRAGASVIYVSADMLSDPVAAGLLRAPGRDGWRVISAGSGPEGPWRILVRTGSAPDTLG
jgi:hypothetical protein